MISFILSLAVLIIGYLVYGRFAERIFSPDDRKTPAVEVNDGVDCISIKPWKAFLIQLLNIAGTGPIFGALMGAAFGPVVFLWIVFGSILGGAVHDYFTGMVSSRHHGASIAELSGIYLDNKVRWILRVACLILLVLVGAVFVESPAALLARLTPNVLSNEFWILVILIYYVFATLLPIDKIIGRLYPVFGVILVGMALGIIGGIFFQKDYHIMEITFQNLHPDKLPVWPFMFVTVACGAVSGFHATQSPMMAKCIMKEKDGRPVFYGAMIAEAVIALIWAAAGTAFYGSTQMLQDALSVSGQSGVVYEISKGILGNVGSLLAILGVIICPISSGDTAFRAARLILAECTGLKQGLIKNRLLLSFPLLIVGAILTQLDFDVLWRYFALCNQTLAVMALWGATSYLIQNNIKRIKSLITAIPATFMTAVSVTYILMAPEGLHLHEMLAHPIGIMGAALVFCVYLYFLLRKKNNNMEQKEV